MRRLLTILIGLALGSCQWIPVLAEHPQADTATQSPMAISADVDSLADSLTISATWADVVTMLADADSTGLTFRVVPGMQYASPIGPWPCRWIRWERQVAAYTTRVFYEVRGGIAYSNETYSSEAAVFTMRTIVDSIWHCDGDGDFAR